MLDDITQEMRRQMTFDQRQEATVRILAEFVRRQELQRDAAMMAAEPPKKTTTRIRPPGFKMYEVRERPTSITEATL